MNNECSKQDKNTQAMGWRVSASILGGVGWLVFIIIWLFFYAKGYVWEKNLAIVILSLLVLCGLIGIPWAIWAIRNNYMKEDPNWKLKGFKGRVWFSILLMIGALLFLVYWFWMYAAPYDVYQNVAVFIVGLLIPGGILAALWAPWGMKHGHDQQHHHHNSCDCSCDCSDHDSEKTEK